MASKPPTKPPVILAPSPAAEPETPPKRVSRHIQPLGPRILVRLLRSHDRTDSGLFLPQGLKDASSEALLAEVIEVARTLPTTEVELDDATDDDETERVDLGKNVSGVPLGAHILFEKSRGVSVPWDESLRLLEVRYVLAIVEIITEDEMQ